jgi:hypothetical protein
MSTEIVRAAPMGLEEQIHYAQAMAGASLLPEAYRKAPANILIAMQAAESLGITPFQAIQGIDVISGKMSLSAELMRALIQREGHYFRVDVLTANGCRLLVARKEDREDVQTFEYTREDAKLAGLTGGNHAKHPKAMMLARATTMAARAVFADVIGGFAATHELEDERSERRVDTSRLVPPSRAADPEPDAVEAELVEEPMHIVDEETGEIVEAIVESPVPTNELPY